VGREVGQEVKGKGASGDGLNVLTIYNADMVPPLNLSFTSTKRGSSGEHITRRRLQTALELTLEIPCPHNLRTWRGVDVIILFFEAWVMRESTCTTAIML